MKCNSCGYNEEDYNADEFIGIFANGINFSTTGKKSCALFGLSAKERRKIEHGFPADHCVLRIDPIFPSKKGMERVMQVLHYFMSLNTGVARIRISLVDEYKHVKERYYKWGWTPLYGDNFYPSCEQKKLAAIF